MPIKKLRLLIPLLLALGLGTGCGLLIDATSGRIRRGIHITSEPAGASVRVNDEFHGRTPVTVPIIWYWYYDVEVKKEGYETLKARERIYAPPYFYIPFDFFFELQPFRIYDTRYRHYFLSPTPDL